MAIIEEPSTDLRKRRDLLMEALGRSAEDNAPPGRERVLLRDLTRGLILHDVRGDFVAFSTDDPRLVSYAPKPEWKYDDDHRTRTSLGRYLRRQMGVSEDDVSDRTIEKLSYGVFAVGANHEDATGIEVEVLHGEDIIDAYTDSVGAGACMAYPVFKRKTRNNTFSYISFIKRPKAKQL